MALIGVMITPDRAWRVEVHRIRDRVRYRVTRRTMPMGVYHSPEEVAALMARWGADFADLVPD